MNILLILALGAVSIVIGKIAFGKWYNHVSLYSAIWSVTLALCEMRYINYYTFESETWLIIIVTWLLFILGSLTVVAARATVWKKESALNKPEEEFTPEKEKELKTILWSLNIITFLAALHSLYIVSKVFGGLSNVFLFGNFLYSYRVAEGIPGSIPYLSSLVFAAALIAGRYTAHIGKITIVAILPLIIVIMIDFANMGRVDILVATLLFTSSFFLTSKKRIIQIKKFSAKMKRVLMVAAVIAIIVGGAEFIRSTRKPSEGFTGTTKTLQKFSKASFITPSIYLYFSAHHVVFNQYLKHGGENTPFGGHTFSSIYKILEKLGFDVHVENYQARYKTPVATNTGTYLRELHGDFGITGLLLGPYLLGLFTSIFWFRVKDYGRYTDLTIAAFLFVIVGLSFFVMATRMGALFVYLISSLIISAFIDRKQKGTLKASSETY